MQPEQGAKQPVARAATLYLCAVCGEKEKRDKQQQQQQQQQQGQRGY